MPFCSTNTGTNLFKPPRGLDPRKKSGAILMGLGLQKKLDCGCGCGGLKKSDRVKFKYSIYSALVFFLVSNPETYKLTSSILGNWVAGPSGCPSPSGLFIHTAVFIALIFFLMKIRS
jgi:hypothetical protein